MSTSQAREINKNNKLTIHQAKIVLNNHLRCGNDSLISIFIKLNSLVIFPWFVRWYVFITITFRAGTEHKADDIEK